MSKVAVVYWSGTGNTEMMAQKVAEGAKEAGAEVSVLTCADFSADDVDAYDAIAFGCPAMGAEELEDTEFEPMFSACESKLSGKKIALFGSYGWGGQSAAILEKNMDEAKFEVVSNIKVRYIPDDNQLMDIKQELEKSI